MGRRKVPMGLIGNPRLRANTFGKRKEGLKKKANELAVLCGVDVALVVAPAPPPPPADGDGGAVGLAAAVDVDVGVWESREGVLARYRELEPAARARHTFRDYLYAELGKEEAKLARVRQAGPDGLDCWDKALGAVDTVDDARSLLAAVDAAIRAADDRRRALGMPLDDGDDDNGAGVVLEGVAPRDSAHVDDGYHAHGGANAGVQAMAMSMWGTNVFHHHHLSGAAAAGNMQYGFHQQFSSGGGNLAAMDGGYELQQMVPDMYRYSNGGGGLLAADAYQYHHHGYVFPCAGYFGMPSAGGYQQMQQQVLGGAAAQQPNHLAMPGAGEPCHAMMPVPVVDDTQAAHGGAHDDGSGGASFAMDDARGDFVNAPTAFSVAMSTGGGGGGGDNFITAPPAAPSSHSTGGSGSGTSDNFTPAQPLAMSYGGDMAAAGGYATPSGMEQQQQYLGDLEDTQPNPWGN